MKNKAVKVLPRFIGEEGERIFTLQFAGEGKPRAQVVFVPPFGEELNRCRSLVAEQARVFARSGYSCTLFDFYGCGDSQGELRDATLQIWRNNIQLVIDTLQSGEDIPIVLWGLRLGAFIALDFAAKSAIKFEDILLWQPIVSGERYVTQILRQRVAALAGKNLAPETTVEIRKRLADGQTVEISGYTVGGALMADVECLTLASMTALCPGKIHWLENVSEPGAAVSAATVKAIEQLENQDNTIVLHPFTGPQIWQLHKRDSLPELITITSSLLP